MIGSPGWAFLLVLAKHCQKIIASYVAEVRLQCLHWMEMGQGLEGDLRPKARNTLTRDVKTSTDISLGMLRQGSKHLSGRVMGCLAQGPFCGTWRLSEAHHSVGRHWNVLMKGCGNTHRYSVPGSKAFRKYILRPSILFPSGTKAEKEDQAGQGRG